MITPASIAFVRHGFKGKSYFIYENGTMVLKDSNTDVTLSEEHALTPDLFLYTPKTHAGEDVDVGLISRKVSMESANALFQDDMDKKHMVFDSDSDDMKSYKLAMYIIVNTDHDMTPGKIASQVGHAVCLMMLKTKPGDIYNMWLRVGQPIIVLGADAEEFNELIKKEPVAIVHDAGVTQVSPGSATAMVFAPTLGMNQKFDTMKYKLLP